MRRASRRGRVFLVGVKGVKSPLLYFREIRLKLFVGLIFSPAFKIGHGVLILVYNIHYCFLSVAFKVLKISAPTVFLRPPGGNATRQIAVKGFLYSLFSGNIVLVIFQVDFIIFHEIVGYNVAPV